MRPRPSASAAPTKPSMLLLHGIVTEYDGMIRVAPDAGAILAYYANAIAHLTATVMEEHGAAPIRA